MSDSRDTFERRLAEQLAELAETPIPGIKPPDQVVEAVLAESPPIRRLLFFATAGVVAVLATAIALRQAPPGFGSQSPSPSVAAHDAFVVDDPANLEYSCGGQPFAASIFDKPEVDLEGSGAGEALGEFIREGADGGLIPVDGWRLVAVGDSSASYVALTSDDPGFAAAEVKLEDGLWHVDRWGECRPAIVVGNGNASTWLVAPGQVIDSGTTSFVAEVTELSCAGGQSSANRMRPPVVAYGESEVLIAFTVRPLPGKHLCIANPPSEVRVNLSEPLRGRRLLDGGTLPWLDGRAR